MDNMLNHVLRQPFSWQSVEDSRMMPEFTRKPDLRNLDVCFTVSLLILISVLWLATRPYPGVIQDARFYMVQALRQLHPTHFSGDLYFDFGSVNRFTIFSRLCVPLLSILGVGPTGIVLTIFGHVLWVGGLLYLALGLIRPRPYALLAVAVTIALPSAYAVWLTGYGEPFVTPRLFAEALTMIALGFLVRRHTGWALTILAASAAIHPIMTLPGLAIALIYLAFGQPLWWAAIVGGAMAAAGLSMANIQPFANLRVTLDPQWFDVVKVRDWFCFLTRWSVDGYLRVLGTITLAILALVLAEPRERRLLGSALVVGIGGLIGTLIGADVFHNAFIVEIQQYRAIWPLTLMSNLYVVPILVCLLRQGDTVDLTRFGYLVAVSAILLSRFISTVIFAAAPMMIITSAFAIWQYGTGRRLPLLARGFFLSSLALGCAMTILFAIWFKDSMESWPDEFLRRMYSLALVAASLIIIALIIHLIHIERERQQLDRFLPWLAAALLPIALLGWDARTPWTRFVESSGPAPESLTALLPRNASVYWEGSMKILWLRLQRASYFSCSQGSGAVFFRGTAIAYRHREESFWPLRTLDFDRNAQCPSLDRSSKPEERTRADLKEVCRREPALDYLVLIRPVENVAPKVWDSPVPFQYERVVDGKLIVRETNRFFIYSCSGLR
jgi:hypothetical protein